jgi:glycosyltransferase involved in cell wall biosynthesis
MKSVPDVSVAVIFHREDAYAIPALKSLEQLVNFTRKEGLKVEVSAVLDRPSSETERLVRLHGAFLDSSHKVDFGDLGKSRNHATRMMSGRFLAYLDGDDLWGENWLVEAYSCAQSSHHHAVWHPELLYYFDEQDFDTASIGPLPSPSSGSFFFKHVPSEFLSGDRSALLLNNIWSANSFAHRSVYESHPYLPVEREQGFGVEDWAWNVWTVQAGLLHQSVPGTVHLIRVKAEGSLGQQNMREGLLLPLPSDFELEDWVQ